MPQPTRPRRPKLNTRRSVSYTSTGMKTLDSGTVERFHMIRLTEIEGEILRAASDDVAYQEFRSYFSSSCTQFCPKLPGLAHATTCFASRRDDSTLSPASSRFYSWASTLFTRTRSADRRPREAPCTSRWNSAALSCTLGRCLRDGSRHQVLLSERPNKPIAPDIGKESIRSIEALDPRLAERQNSYGISESPGGIGVSGPISASEMASDALSVVRRSPIGISLRKYDEKTTIAEALHSLTLARLSVLT